MKTLRIEIELTSSALIGSGEGYGAIIDTDIVFDELGIPYIPAKRIKGCLKDSAEQVECMFKSSLIDFPLNIPLAFGVAGKEVSNVYFSNLIVEDYENNKDWLTYLSSEYNNILSQDTIVNFFTDIRYQTSIENGVTKPHSLRSIRVINKGHKFYGDIQVDEEQSVIDTLAMACENLRSLGTKRNRGFGEVRCKLFDGERSIFVLERLEPLCKD